MAVIARLLIEVLVIVFKLCQYFSLFIKNLPRPLFENVLLFEESKCDKFWKPAKAFNLRESLLFNRLVSRNKKQNFYLNVQYILRLFNKQSINSDCL